jgi:uncharacterized membrane protein HdeD (DUF308 family)
MPITIERPAVRTGLDKNVQKTINRKFGWAIANSALTVVLGMLALAFAPWTGISAGIAFAVLYILNGGSQLIYAFNTRREGRFFVKFLFSILSIGIGAWLLSVPLVTTTALAFAMIALLIGGGMLEVLLSYQLRPLPHWGWVLFDGMLLMLLGALALMGWPLDSSWMVGTLVGVGLLSVGITRMMALFTLRSFAKKIITE